MKSILLILTCLFSIQFAYPQWNNLGYQGTETQMTENEVGYKVENINGPTPSSGTSYKVYSTSDDWANSSNILSGSGALGCCKLEHLYFLDDNTAVISVSDQSMSRIKKKNSSGSGWTEYDFSLPIFMKDMQVVDNETIFAAGNHSGNEYALLYRLHPEGQEVLANMDSLTFSINDYTPRQYFEFLNQDIGFVMANSFTNRSYLFKTTNGGVALEEKFATENNEFTALSFPTFSIGYIANSDGQLYKTTDGGDNWLALISPTANRINSISFASPSTGYIACNDGEIYFTINGGLSWETENIASGNNIIDIRMVDSFTVYCTEITGVLHKKDHQLSVDEFYPTTAIQIYPNPSSGIYTIQYDKLEKYTVYDIVGKKILEDSANNTIDLTAYSSGQYIVKIESSKEVFTSRIIKE